MEDTYVRRIVEVLKVHDGDTVRVRLDLGFDTYRDVWVRIDGIDAPELKDVGGVSSRDYLALLLIEHKDKLHFLSSKYYSFNRCVGSIGWPDDVSNETIEVKWLMLNADKAKPSGRRTWSADEITISK